MDFKRWIQCGIACVLMSTWSGCASLDELRQTQMLNRNLQAEKEQLVQELYDTRTVTETLRSRSDSLDRQIASKDLLVINLQTENDRLEEAFRTAQGTLGRFADRSLGAPTRELPPELDAALQEFATQYPGAVTYESQFGTVKWTADVLFGFASDTVKQTAYPSLQRFGEIMRLAAAKDFEVLVAGHTDNIPIRRPETLTQHRTNWHLSSHRSIAVARLLQKNGLEPTRVGVVGFGEYRPLAMNDSDANRARNRRVEMYIVPRGRFSAGVNAEAAAMSFTGQKPDDPIK